jgi:RNA polymerase sigma factor (TIGR02999 family)
MASEVHGKITTLLSSAAHGDRRAAADLLPLVYDELRQLARVRMAAEAPGRTLQPTALVHEAYLRVVGSTDPGWDSRGHFFAAAALAMRRILVEQARGRARTKRGGGLQRVRMDDVQLTIEQPSDDVVALDEVLQRLEAEDPRKGQIVNLRYFAGLTAAATADVLGVSVGTIEREWRYIRRWLHMQLRAPQRGATGGNPNAG